MIRSLSILIAFAMVSAGSADDLALPEGIKNTQNVKDVPLTPQEALKRITMPEGFEVTLFAGEPHVRQPIAMEFDDRGRLDNSQDVRVDPRTIERVPGNIIQSPTGHNFIPNQKFKDC